MTVLIWLAYEYGDGIGGGDGDDQYKCMGPLRVQVAALEVIVAEQRRMLDKKDAKNAELRDKHQTRTIPLCVNAADKII